MKLSGMLWNLKSKILLGGLISSALVVAISGCSMDAQILSSSLPQVESVERRTQPDFINGETVTTSNHYQISGAIGEISENQVLDNHYEIQGVFYDAE
ncbi:hypothetical protein [Bdellovibrio sp.]|uniref:hypothetical protein n=1 Tax=Bdellovibrio sp. TaxID=28201 RepID=UPI0039E54124